MGEMDYRDDYRNYRDNYREDYREDYRDYDMRGGKVNHRDYRDYRDYRNYRSNGYHEALELVMYEIRENSRRLEDISEMAKESDKNAIMRIAQKEKESYSQIKQLMEK